MFIKVVFNFDSENIYYINILENEILLGAMNVQKMMPITSKDSDVKDCDSRGTIKVIDRPTFILKTREGENRAVSPNQRNGGNKYLQIVSCIKKNLNYI